MPEPVAVHYSSKRGHIVVASRHHTISPRIIRIGSAVFDIPSFVTNLLYSQKIIHGLPCDTGERHLSGEMENNNLTALHHNQIHWSRGRGDG